MIFETKTGIMQRPAAEPSKSNGIGLAAVPAFQRAQAEEELVQPKATAQLAAPDEELQLKSDTVQKAAQEEELVQKKPAGTEEELPAQGKFVLQKVELPEEETPAQGKFATPFQLKPNNTGLPDNLKTGVENLSGYSLDSVKVHYNSSQPAQLNALAYAQGNDIHIGPGQEQHLPHEAWHVVQQRQGRVKPTLQMKEGVPVNDDPGLEKEADVMGAQAMQHKPMRRG